MISPAEWVSFADAAHLAGVTPKHLRRIVHEVARGFRADWHGRQLMTRGTGAAMEIAVQSLPQEAREAWLIQTYHLNLALPELGRAQPSAQ